MREIKFRLIRDGKIVGWERHCLVDGEIEIFHARHSAQGGFVWWHLIHPSATCSDPQFIPHSSKDQFTGLKDKNGVKIYFNDIEFGKRKCHGLVAWYEELTRIKIVYKNGTADLCPGIYGGNKADIVIVSNIHETPELVENAAHND